ncbi:MAG: DUF4465 domain-containing protein [Bacteroidia bacterium]|nr:MAG: DUF4465 domain-containing protein [Bacteroidia bacterium]
MRFFCTLSALLFCTSLSTYGQAYLVPEQGHKVAFHFSDTVSVRTFDVNEEFFYFDDGDTIYQIDPNMGGASKKFGKPDDYDVLHYPSFLNLSSDGASLWAGYTDSDNVDARIYRIDVETGVWELKAKMAANWDLAFWNDSLLVSGLNSTDYNEPNGIFILDSSGFDQHRKVIETGGNSAGMAVDSHGNLYYGTSFLSGPNALYRWDSTDLADVIETPGAIPLQLADAEKLTDLPMGVYDCEVDGGDHVVFSMNVWGGSQVLARWNGIPGDGSHYDTLAISEAWLGMVKSRGDYTIQVPGNSLFTVGYGEPVADLHTCDYPPIQTQALPVITGQEGAQLDPQDLNRFFRDLDDPGGLTFAVSFLSDPSVASFTVEGTLLTGTFAAAGQANLVIEGSSAGRSVSGRTVVGTWPVLEGEFQISGFEDLNLMEESYWNGSDGSGAFSSGLARFHNDFNPDYYSWSGWSYSNISDNTTPGYMNQYSAITGGGFAGDMSAGNFGTSSLYGPSVIDFTLEKAHALKGFFVTNSTYAALSMKLGDWVAKKFGGSDGTDPDYFKLLVWGRRNGTSTDTLDYYLADFRFENPEMDYIIETWQWVDLGSLGKVDSLMFGLESSDMGDWGMNTPAYFCLDDLYVLPDAAPYVANPLSDFATFGYLSDTVIDLSQVFSDPDDPDLEITKRIVSNSDSNMAFASIDGDELSIQFAYLTKAAYQSTMIEIVIEGTSNGLSVRDSFEISHQPGGVEYRNAMVVSVYPNPSTGLFTIEGGQGDVQKVSLYSLSGTLLYENRQFELGRQLDITTYPAGSYILRVQGQNRTGRILIQKL